MSGTPSKTPRRLTVFDCVDAKQFVKLRLISCNFFHFFRNSVKRHRIKNQGMTCSIVSMQNNS